MTADTLKSLEPILKEEPITSAGFFPEKNLAAVDAVITADAGELRADNGFPAMNSCVNNFYHDKSRVSKKLDE